MKTIQFTIIVIVTISTVLTTSVFAQNVTNSTMPHNAIKTHDGGWVTPIQTTDQNGKNLTIHYETGIPVSGYANPGPPPDPVYLTDSKGNIDNFLTNHQILIRADAWPESPSIRTMDIGINMTSDTGFAFDDKKHLVFGSDTNHMQQIIWKFIPTKAGNYTVEKFSNGMHTSSTFFSVFDSKPSPNSPVLVSPLWQFKWGILQENIQCQINLVLMFKTEYNSPACVKPDTGQKLIEHGWGKILPRENKPVSESIPDANNKFAFSLFSNILQKDNGNVFFSPYSISNAFSMVYEGASGNTRDEIQSVFGFIQDDTIRRNNIKSIDSQLNDPNQEYKLDTANALWIQNDFPVLPRFADTLSEYYSANATNLDFIKYPEHSRQTINTWVENKTNQKIKDLLPLDSITDQTRVILTNAIYFLGNWTNPFDEHSTKEENFTTEDQRIVKIPMMTTQSNFKYLSNNDLQVLEMPYRGGHLSMIVLLPNGDNLKSFVESLSVGKLHQLQASLTAEEGTVYMPKFTLNTKVLLNDNLASMGMPSAFSGNADFTGITGKKDLSISMVVHQAFVKVDEKGTEAAAATGIVMETSAMAVSQFTFRADHPFVFSIYDNQTGLILFMGKVVDPSSG